MVLSLVLFGLFSAICFFYVAFTYLFFYFGLAKATEDPAFLPPLPRPLLAGVRFLLCELSDSSTSGSSRSCESSNSSSCSSSISDFFSSSFYFS
jgi:hypothetical protein